MAATKNSPDGTRVAGWLRREVEIAIEVLERAEPWEVEEAEKALLAAASPLTGLKSREADELWKLVGRARGTAHQAVLAERLTSLAAEPRFGNGHPERNHRNGRPVKPVQSLPSGKLSQSAGTRPEPWQARDEMHRRRAMEAQAAVVSHRGQVLPMSANNRRRKKKGGK